MPIKDQIKNYAKKLVEIVENHPRRSVPFVRLEWLRSEGSTIYCRAGTGRTRKISRQINAGRIKEGASGAGEPFLN